MSGALTSDVGQRPRLLERLAASAPRRNHDRIAQLGERQEVAPIQRQLHHLAVLDDVADLGRLRLEQRGGAVDYHLLGEALNTERELQAERPPNLEDNPHLHLRSKTAQRGGDVPGPNAQAS